MNIRTYGSVLAYVATAVTFVVVFFILFSGGDFSHSFSHTNSKSEFLIPIVQLQTKLNLNRQHSSASSHFRSSLPRNPTISTGRRPPELELARARGAIQGAATVRNLSQLLRNGDVLASDIYHNPSAFYQSYIEMEKIFKVYVYEEGEVPIVHDGPCKDIYTIEGRFIQEMEQGRNFRTKDAHKAHVYFMPFSVTWMVKYLYKPDSYDITPLQQFVSDYVRIISDKHPFWNTTNAADHFMLSCHDWGPHASKGNPSLYNSSIRVLCNANSSEGFDPQKDVSLPEINLRNGNMPSNLIPLPPPSSPRPHLAFFAGGVHGPIRPILLNYWKGRDPDLQVYDYLPKGLDYYSFMLASKYCLCPSGYEVASPRIVEAVYSECVPVIISEHYVLPFSEVLRWEAFSIQVNVSEVAELKRILTSVPENKYLRMKENLRAVRRHFVLNQPAERFDVFHMILHSVWLRRLNLKLEV
ncbi:hypothetical protein L1987_80812 [Smallanthus sonchifolius]|uniref:Uncharacterized protein n=1 Tax=Smallanthus sonchifolius TaxID=185202 RepID=A0ACB8YPE5_9ASTR|nr:hypothetical protein L1987_80812 [Smallanthus sonchifolius]